MDVHVFSDESGIGERFVCYGAVVVPSDEVEGLEAGLEGFCSEVGLGEREMSWKKCSPRETDRYCGFADRFFEAQDTCRSLDFRSLVIDTERNPLKDPYWRCETDEDGFYRFYHYFITKSLEVLYTRVDACTIILGSADDQYPFRTDILTKTVAGELRRHFGVEYEVIDLSRDRPKASRIHQLADVLLGAVSYRMNERESHKESICALVEGRVDKSLRERFYSSERPFNVWHFTRRGDERWAEGSSGRVT